MGKEEGEGGGGKGQEVQQTRGSVKIQLETSV